MDNFRIDITSRGDLTRAIDLALRRDYPDRPTKVAGYAIFPAGPVGYDKVEKPQRIVFYWTNPGENVTGFEALPSLVTLDTKGIADLIQRWLDSVEYGCQPDHDGHNSKGWRLYNEKWGHVDNCSRAIFAVTPVWAMYGK